MSEEERLRALMACSLQGDGSAHAALLRAITPPLRAFFRRKMKNDETAEDLLQETLIAIHFRRESYDLDRRFSGWLFAIAQYKLIDHFRRSTHSRALVPLDLHAELVGDDGFGETVDASLDVEKMLATLPSKQASAIRRTRLDGQSIAEVAQATGLSESDVKVSVHRGMKTLASRFGRW